MLRRQVLSGLLGLAGLAWGEPAFAGSYLDRAALLLEGSRKDGAALRGKLTDRELARVIQIVAEARLTAASKMDVPAAVAKAHPHLLLSLTKLERAANAAKDEGYRSAVEHLDAAMREDAVFRGVLKELGHPLPKASHG